MTYSKAENRNTRGLATSTLLLVLAIAAVLGCAREAAAQTVSIDLADGEGGLSGRVIQLFLLVSLLSLAPGIAMMVTCFPFMVTVLSLLRQGIGLQAAPPNMMIISLALFLTYFVMEPVFVEAWTTGIRPLVDGDISPEQSFSRAMAPFQGFLHVHHPLS